jgi:glycosyltransferase involved in cell wall biosynthesis
VEEAIFFTKFLNCLVDAKLKRKNCRIDERYHLLVSLKPENGDDALYAEQLIQFVKKHALSVTIGLNDLVSLEREVDPSDSSQIMIYGVGDIYRAADLVITTSILEGFGFSYIEPWIIDRAVIGRSIPFITPDFQAAGMKLGHLYAALIVDGQDFKDIGRETEDPTEALKMRLEKILKLDRADNLNAFIERNETSILATLRLFDEEKRRAIIALNREVVERVYSQENIGRQLYQIITSE